MSNKEIFDKTCAKGAQYGAMAIQQISKGLLISGELLKSMHEKMTNKCNDGACQSEAKHDNHTFEGKMHAQNQQHQNHQQQNQHQHNQKNQNHKHH